MNKKILTIISVVVLSLTLAASWAFSASASNRNAKGYGECQQGVTGQSYVDDNNDGVCDNIGSTRVPPQDGTGRQNGHRNGKNR